MVFSMKSTFSDAVNQSLSEVTVASHSTLIVLPSVAKENTLSYAAKNLGLGGRWDQMQWILFQRPSAMHFFVLLFIYCSATCRGKCVDVFSERPAEIKCVEC